MQDYSIERVGIPNLDFTGDLIGQSAGPNSRVRIYRTAAGHYVGQLASDTKRSNADKRNTSEELIAWFRRFTAGQIDPDVQAAIEEGANKDEGFKKAWNEHVD